MNPHDKQKQDRERDQLHRIVETDRRQALQSQVKREAEELKNAPVIKVVTGAVLRCHCCGEVVDQLYEDRAPIPTAPQFAPHPAHKMLCKHCHPTVRLEWWKLPQSHRVR